jgi:vitamin B12 transporter
LQEKYYPKINFLTQTNLIMIKKITLLLAGSLAVAVIAQAQNTNRHSEQASPILVSNDSLHALSEVIIQENRLQLPFEQQNRNIRVIDQAVIKTLPVRSVSELLAYVSGVDVRQRGPRGSQSDIGLDGGTFDQTLLLVNGVKVTDPQTGHNMLNIPIPLDMIDHIEVLRGSAARIYGVNALTGAINIVTRKPEKCGATASVYGGSSFKKDETNGDTYHNFGVQATAGLVNNFGKNTVSLSQDAGNGYRYNTAYKNQKAFYQGNFKTGGQSQLDVMAGFIRNNFGANAFYAAPGDKEAEETVEATLASVSYKTHLNPAWTFTPRASYRYNQDDYLYIKQTPDKYHNLHKSQTVSLELNNSLETSIGTFGLGLEGRNEHINSTNLGKRDRSNFGVFSEYRFDKVERLVVNVGAYTNYNSDYGWQVYPGMDAGYNIHKNWKVYMNTGTAQRLPTYTDLYYKGPANIGNDQLKPEKSVYGEGGIKYSDKQLTFNTSYFYRRVSNFIDWVKENTTDPWQPNNFQQINTSGYTTSADYRISNPGWSLPVTNLTTGISFTYLDPKFKKPTEQENKISRYAVESLRNQICGTVNAEFFNHFSVTAAARYCERISYKNYTLLDARLEYKNKFYSIYTDATNLLDVSYIEAGAVPMPGRWYNLGLRLSL